jgi:hypothetical protein
LHSDSESKHYNHIFIPEYHPISAPKYEKGESAMESFYKLLYKAMDDTIRHVLGDANSKLIQNYIEKQGSFTREELYKKIEIFYAFLEKLIGIHGAQILKITSFQYLLEKLKTEYEEVEKYLSLLDELYELKFKLVTTSIKRESPNWN